MVNITENFDAKRLYSIEYYMHDSYKMHEDVKMTRDNMKLS